MLISKKIHIFLILLLGCLSIGSDCVRHNHAPTEPVYIAPDSASNVFGPDVQLFWHHCTDADEDEVTYGVRYGNDEHDWAEIITDLSDTNYIITGLELEDTVYWEVFSRDDEDYDYGPIWFFTVTELLTDGTPVYPNPDSGAIDININADLSWDYAGPQVEVIYCDVYFGENQDPGLVSDNLNSATYDPGAMDYLTEYYWKIVAFTSPTDSVIGSIWSFTTGEEEEPPAPQTPNPADGAISVSVATDLNWEYSGTPEDVIYCDVYLGTNSDPGLVNDNQVGTTYDPPGNLEFATAYYWKVVSFTSPADSIVGPVWTFNTEIIVTQDIYAKFTFIANIMEFFAMDKIVARFDSSYAPDSVIIPLQADSVTVNDITILWSSYPGEYAYYGESSTHWLVDGGDYNFEVFGNAQVPDLTLETTYLECTPIITSPATADTVYLTGFTTQWDGICAGNVFLTFVLAGGDTADVRIETPNDGEYEFTETDLLPLGGYTGVISLVIISEDSYYIDEPGYQVLSEVFMRSMYTATVIIQ